jgi:lysozyme family protein
MVKPLYKRKYWDACRTDELVSGVDYVVFDVAVNSGTGRAIKILQDCVGATVDGGFGPATMELVKKASHEPNKIIDLYCAKRLEFLQSLRTFETFGKGWSRRVAEVKEKALKMTDYG